MTKQSSVTIKLNEPLQTASGFVQDVTFRAPIVDDYFEIGDLVSYVTLPGRSVVAQDNMGAYRQYAERLVQAPVSPIDLGNGNFRLAGQIREVIDGFFTDARRAGEPSKDSSNNSGEQGSSASTTSNG